MGARALVRGHASFSSRGGLGPDEASLMSEDDELDSVSSAELW
jgi:hypothetical protein